MEFVVVTGQSGAGRSHAANYLEDLGWFVIDNLPTSLIPKISELATDQSNSFDRVALVTGSSSDTAALCLALQNLRDQDSRLRIVFLQASTPTLVRRYISSKRPHPFDARMDLVDAIEAESSSLDPIRAEADLVIDTSNTSVYQLRDRIEAEFSQEDETNAMSIRVMSFGYKHGLPIEADLVIDCRFLPNPHWVPELRPLSGRDPEIGVYLEKQAITSDFLDRLYSLTDLLMPAYEHEGKSYLTIAIGCTGGRHRSVWVAGQLRTQLELVGYTPRVSHRDIDRGG